MKTKVLAAVPCVVGSLLIACGHIIQGSPGMRFFAFGLAALMILPVTALLCWFRMKRGNGISYGTALTGAFGAVLLTDCVVLVRVARYESWTAAYCAGWITGCFFLSLCCVLPALGIVHYYQKKAVAGNL